MKKIVVLARVEPGSEILVMRKLKAIPGVTYSQVLFGEFDILIHMEGADCMATADDIISKIQDVLEIRILEPE